MVLMRRWYILHIFSLPKFFSGIIMRVGVCRNYSLILIMSYLIPKHLPPSQVTYQNIIDLITIDGSFVGLPGLNINESGQSRKYPRVSYVVPSGIKEAISFLMISTQATAIPLSDSMTREELRQSFEESSAFIIVDPSEVFENSTNGKKFHSRLCEEISSVNSINKLTPSRQSVVHVYKVCMSIKSAQLSAAWWIGKECGNGNATDFFTSYNFSKVDRPSTPQIPCTNADDIAVSLRTSGTTSTKLTKLVQIRSGSLVAVAKILGRSLGLQNLDVGVNAMPLHHIGGLLGNILTPISVGARVIVLPAFDAEQICHILRHGFDLGDHIVPDILALDSSLDLVQNHLMPTWYHAAPSMHAAILKAMEGKLHEEMSNHRLRLIRCAAAPLSEDIAQSLVKVFGLSSSSNTTENVNLKNGFRLVNSYGMTELMPIAQCPRNLASPFVYPGAAITVGLPCSGSVMIYNPSRNDMYSVADGPGEICLLSEFAFIDYLGMEMHGSPFFLSRTGEEVFRTGDLGYLDGEGYLYITGRLKDMIKRGGVQINPLQLEDDIRQAFGEDYFNENISTLMALGIPHPILGEAIAVYLTLSRTSKIIISEDQNEWRLMISKKLANIGSAHATLIDTCFILKNDEARTLEYTFTKKLKRSASRDIILSKTTNRTKSNGNEFQEPKQIEKNSSTIPSRPTLTPALSGVSFFLALGVMWNHLFSDDESADRTRIWFHHESQFFWLGGFFMAYNRHFHVVKKEELSSFYQRMYMSLHPLYLVSLILVCVNFIIFCNPNVYNQNHVHVQGEESTCVPPVKLLGVES